MRVREDISTPSHHRQLTSVATIEKSAGLYTIRIACWEADNEVNADRANLVLVGTKNAATS